MSCFFIKVHLVNEGNRGATLETIINRLKIIPKIVNTFIFKQ